jgi:hypothetical protein
MGILVNHLLSRKHLGCGKGTSLFLGIRRFGCIGQGVIGLFSYFVLPVWVCFGSGRFSCTKIAMLFLVNVIEAIYLNRLTWDICALLTNRCQ